MSNDKKAKLEYGESPVDPSFWYLKAPLYHSENYWFEGATSILGYKDLRKNLMAVIFPMITIDVFCKNCGRETVFSPVIRESKGWSNEKLQEIIPSGVCYAHFKCSRRSCGSNLYFIFDLVQKRFKKPELNTVELTKIGQLPSIADLVTPELQKYRNVLSAEQLANWQRAVGLRAHGIGAGSYVYLRRIIEDLIEEARASAGDSIDPDVYKKSRWPERIKLLSGHLPSYLVQNAAVYGILSKGVHQLSEEDCSNYFSVLHTAMELICDDKLAEIDRENKAKAGAKALQQVLSTLAKDEGKGSEA